MRTSTTWMVLGLCGLFATTGCATMKSIEKEAEKDVKKEVTAVKEGKVGEIGGAALGIAVTKKLSDDAALKGAKIDADVKDSTVTLKGTATAEQKAHAEKTVKDIPGVTKVVNDIKAGGADKAGDKPADKAGDKPADKAGDDNKRKEPAKAKGK